MTTELDVARAVAEGTIPSPTTWMNAQYIACRISGVGCAWREGPQEYSVRDRNDWCSAIFLRRCLGLPLVWQHPPTGTLTSKYFGDNICGYCLYSYVHPERDEPWGVFRVLDANAAIIFASGECDTSPGVVIEPENCSATEVDGKKLLCEGLPKLLDHLAICSKGVWTRDNEPGVQVDSAKTDWTAAYDYGAGKT